MAKNQPTQQNTQNQRQQGTMNTNKPQTDRDALNKNKWQQGGTTQGGATTPGNISNQGKGGFQQKQGTNLGQGQQANRGGFGGTGTDKNRK